MSEILISPSEAARRLGIGRTLLYELLAADRISAVRLGHRTLVPVAELERFATSLPRRNDGPAVPGRITRETLRDLQEAAR